MSHFPKWNGCIVVLQENVLVLWRYLLTYSGVACHDIHNSLLRGLAKKKKKAYVCVHTCVHKNLYEHISILKHTFVFGERERKATMWQNCKRICNFSWVFIERLKAFLRLRVFHAQNVGGKSMTPQVYFLASHLDGWYPKSTWMLWTTTRKIDRHYL